MSNLNSLFDLQFGFPPDGVSALESSYPQKTGESPELVEGDFAVIEATAGHTPVFTKLTSSRAQAITLAVNLPDQPWLIVQGADQIDASASGYITALKLGTGVIFKVATPVAIHPGSLVRAGSAGGVSRPRQRRQAGRADHRCRCHRRRCPGGQVPTARRSGAGVQRYRRVHRRRSLT